MDARGERRRPPSMPRERDHPRSTAVSSIAFLVREKKEGGKGEKGRKGRKGDGKGRWDFVAALPACLVVVSVGKKKRRKKERTPRGCGVRLDGRSLKPLLKEKKEKEGEGGGGRGERRRQPARRLPRSIAFPPPQRKKREEKKREKKKKRGEKGEMPVFTSEVLTASANRRGEGEKREKRGREKDDTAHYLDQPDGSRRARPSCLASIPPTLLCCLG